MKKIYSFLSIIVMLTMIPTVAFGSGSEVNTNLTESEVTEIVMKIADKYELGEEISKEDQKFIETYLGTNVGKNNTIPDQKLNKTANINKTAYNSTKRLGVWVAGSIWHDIQNLANHKFGGTINAYGQGVDGKKITKINVKIRHVAFGSDGGGIKKVYDGALSSTCNTYSYCQVSGDKNYTAVVLYATTSVEATVTHPDGSVTVTAP